MKVNVKCLAVMAALALAGCGSDDDGLSYNPSIKDPIPFVLPYGPDSVKITEVWESAQRRLLLSDYKQPDKWVIYFATAPFSTEHNGYNFNTGSSRSFDPETRERLDNDVSEQIILFLEKYELRDRVDLVRVRYDAPYDLRLGPLHRVPPEKMLPRSLQNADLPKYFDDYVISPAARFPGQPGMLYSDWIRPFLVFSEGFDGEVQRSYAAKNGLDDLQGTFWDSWGRNYFVVDPDGMVRDAYVTPLVFGTHPIQPLISIAHHMGLDIEDVDFPVFDPEKNYRAFYKR